MMAAPNVAVSTGLPPVIPPPSLATFPPSIDPPSTPPAVLNWRRTVYLTIDNLMMTVSQIARVLQIHLFFHRLHHHQ
jgi:hypothetical protein